VDLKATILLVRHVLRLHPRPKEVLLTPKRDSDCSQSRRLLAPSILKYGMLMICSVVAGPHQVHGGIHATFLLV